MRIRHIHPEPEGGKRLARQAAIHRRCLRLLQALEEKGT